MEENFVEYVIVKETKNIFVPVEQNECMSV